MPSAVAIHLHSLLRRGSPVRKVRSRRALFLLAAVSIFAYFQWRSNGEHRNNNNTNVHVLSGGVARRRTSVHVGGPSTVQDELSPEVVAAVAADVADDIKTVWKHQSQRDPLYNATTFRWDDVDFHLTFPCGVLKCFFSSLSDPAHGYLVWKRGERGLSLSEAKRTYAYAQRLAARHHVRHFLTGPPFEVIAVPKTIRQRMSDAGRGRSLRPLEHLADPAAVIVQPSRAAPQGSVALKCRAPPPRAYGGLRWPGDTEILRAGRSNARLLRELAHARAVLAAEPALARDYQVMVDPEGRAYQLDLDRTLRKQVRGKAVAGERPEACLEGALRYIQIHVVPRLRAGRVKGASEGSPTGEVS